VIVAIPIAIVILIAGASLFLLANRQRAATGNLSRETRRRDENTAAAGDSPASGSTEVELSAEARARADEARDQASGGVPAKRRDSGITAWEPVDEEEIGVTRRQFLNRGILVTMLAGLGTFGASLLAFLWPSSSAGFGGKIGAGKLSDIMSFMTTNKQPF